MEFKLVCGFHQPLHILLFSLSSFITKKYLCSFLGKDFSCTECQDRTAVAPAAATPHTHCYFTPKGCIKKLADHSVKLPWPLQQEKCRNVVVHNCELEATITDNNHKTRDRALHLILSPSTAVRFVFCTCFYATLTVLKHFTPTGSTPLQMFQAFFSLLWCACIQISLECLTVHVTCLEMHITSV